MFTKRRKEAFSLAGFAGKGAEAEQTEGVDYLGNLSKLEIMRDPNLRDAADFVKPNSISLNEEGPRRSWKEYTAEAYDGDPVCMYPTAKDFDKGAKAMGWKSAKDFEEDTGVKAEELIGKWFITIGNENEANRVYLID